MREHEGERERECVCVCLRDVKGILTIDNTSEMVLRDYLVIFLSVLVCPNSDFSHGQDVKYDNDRDVTPPLSFLQCKQARSSEIRIQQMRIYKEIESERCSHQRCRPDFSHES